MGNSQGSGTPIDALRGTPETQSISIAPDDFERRWKVFLQSLDISSGHVKHVESLDKQKKIELLLSFESKNPLCNVAKSINLLKNLDWNQILGNNRKRDCGATLRSLLSSTEISLRTNSVDWVYEFLQCDGIEVLSDFMATCLHLLSSSCVRPKRSAGQQSCSSPSVHRSNQGSQVASSLPTFDYAVGLSNENGDSQLRHDMNRSRQPVPEGIKDLLKDCLHLSLRCLKTILNNQTGCKRAFEYPLVIRVITFCLLHPSFTTKALALDLLTALCLIEGGHIKVLQAFDHLRQVMGEGLRFEMLLDSFRHHETLDVEQYNIDFAVACVQFFNIVVHSPENINLRVYLQYELYLLGLDEVLKKLKDKAGDRLVQHIEAYLDNRVDCSLLLEDAEAKETAVSELERLEVELTSKISTARETARMEAEVAFKTRELELSELVESLRSRIRDLNVASWDRENAMKHRMDELQQALQTSRSEVNKLQAALDALKTSTVSSEKVFASMATSTHFDVDANGNPEVINDVTLSGRKETTRSASMITGCQLQTVQPSQSVDRAVRVKRETPLAGAIFEGVKSDTGDRRTSSHKICNNGPQKPVRKQSNMDAVDKPADHPVVPDNTVIRRLAADAATTLSQLVSNASSHGPNIPNSSPSPSSPYFIVPPCAWPYTPNTTISSSDTLFGSDALQKSLSLHPNSLSVSVTDASSLDEIWNRHWNRLSEPWLAAAQQTSTTFSSNCKDTGSLPNKIRPPSFSWLTDLELVPVRVDELSSALNQSSQGDSLVRDWKLYRLLVRCALPCLPAQRLLWQLRAEARLCPSSSPHSRFRVLDQIEIGLTERFGAVRQPDWRFHTVEDNRWFWTSALLRISLIWQLFPVELQRVVEGLSALLAGCTTILVNTKLPVILQLAILFAQRILVDWTVDTFDLRCLDAMIDWNLSGLAFPAPGLHPPMNGGPPAYSNPSTSVDGYGSHMGSQRKSTTRTGSSFLVAFVQLVSQVAPSLMDWPTELTHIEPALRVSIEDILLRIQDTKTALDVWRAISHIFSTEPETDDCQCTTQSHIQSILQDVDQQLIRLLQAAESTRTVVQSTAHWLRITSSSSSTLSVHTEWLAPIIRFAAAFKKCASDVERKRRNGVDTAPGLAPSHRHEHRRGKNEKTHQSHNDDKPEHRRRKHRTRQLDSDGIMDDILAGLTYQPLRTDIHTKRKESLGNKASN